METILGLVPLVEVKLNWQEVPVANMKYTYVIQCLETMKLKIGVADDVDRRVEELQRTSPTELQLCGFVPSEGFTLERHLRKLFAEFRQHETKLKRN